MKHLASCQILLFLASWVFHWSQRLSFKPPRQTVNGRCAYRVVRSQNLARTARDVLNGQLGGVVTACRPRREDEQGLLERYFGRSERTLPGNWEALLLAGSYRGARHLWALPGGWKLFPDLPMLLRTMNSDGADHQGVPSKSPLRSLPALARLAVGSGYPSRGSHELGHDGGSSRNPSSGGAAVVPPAR